MLYPGVLKSKHITSLIGIIIRMGEDRYDSWERVSFARVRFIPWISRRGIHVCMAVWFDCNGFVIHQHDFGMNNINQILVDTGTAINSYANVLLPSATICTLLKSGKNHEIESSANQRAGILIVLDPATITVQYWVILIPRSYSSIIGWDYSPRKEIHALNRKGVKNNIK